MKTEKQMWKDINKPKVEELFIEKDENTGEYRIIAKLLDRIPIWSIEENRKRRKQQ
jgi:hypothetical protein